VRACALPGIAEIRTPSPRKFREHTRRALARDPQLGYRSFALGAHAGPREGLSPPSSLRSLHGSLRAGQLADRWHSAWRRYGQAAPVTSGSRPAQTAGERASAVGGRTVARGANAARARLRLRIL